MHVAMIWQYACECICIECTVYVGVVVCIYYMGALCYAYLPADTGNRSGYYGVRCAGYTGEHYETDIDECASSYGYCVYSLCRLHRCSL